MITVKEKRKVEERGVEEKAWTDRGFLANLIFNFALGQDGFVKSKKLFI